MPAVSRRAFLGAAASAAALGLCPATRGWADEADHIYGGHALGIQSYTLRKLSVSDALKATHDLGLTRVELFSTHCPRTADPEALAAMKKLLADNGLRVSAHGVNGFSKDHDENEKWFVFAKALGIPILTAQPSLDSFDSLDKLVQQYDIKIAIHNHGPKSLYSKVGDVLKAIDGRDPRIGGCADTGNYLLSGEDPVKAVTLLGDRLHGLHVKDCDALGEKAKGVIIGTGVLDLAGLFAVLKKNNFSKNGSLSLEYEEHPQDPIADVKQSLANIDAAMKKVFG